MIEKTPFKRFVKRSMILFTALALTCAFIFYWIIPQHYFQFVPFVFLYFFILNLITFSFFTRVNRITYQEFARQFMIITGIKLFGSIIFVFIYLFFRPEHAIPFLVIFIILYFSTLIQGVHDFLRILNQRKPS